MGVELIIIGIIAGAAVLISGISAGVSIGTIFHFKKKFQSVEKVESKDTTDVTIKNEATKEEHVDGSSTTVRKQEIHITDIDMDIGSKLISGSTTVTRTGLPNKTAETLAGGATGALNKLTVGVVPQLVGAVSEDNGQGIGNTLLKGGMRLIEVEEDDSKGTELSSRTVRTARKDIELDEPAMNSDESSEDHIMESDSGKQGTNSSSLEKSEVTREQHITKLASSIIEEAIGGDMVEMISVPIDGQGVMGDAIVETVDI